MELETLVQARKGGVGTNKSIMLNRSICVMTKRTQFGKVWHRNLKSKMRLAPL
jgi:hypothetical protein